jgi:hypothetical protein
VNDYSEGFSAGVKATAEFYANFQEKYERTDAVMVEAKARIEKALAWCDLADEASYGTLSSGVIRTALTGEEEK